MGWKGYGVPVSPVEGSCLTVNVDSRDDGLIFNHIYENGEHKSEE